MKNFESIRPALMRLVDIIAVLTGVVLLAPLFVTIAVLIVICDEGPVFFRQIRIGRNGEPFKIWKFRTMRARSSGSAVTSADDPRVTRIGTWLRKLKLDELPQFFNVVTGDMSLIGPRPEAPEFVELDNSLWQAVLQVRPGITDLATLLYRNEEEILVPIANPDDYYRTSILPTKLQLNLQYAQSRSLGRDLRLLWLTARYSFFPRGFNQNRIARSFGI